MQIQINKFLVVLLAIVLLGIGCTPPETSQNNGMGSNNQNTTNQNSPANANTPLTKCTAQSIKGLITSLPRGIKDQFKEPGSTGEGTISLNYDEGNHVLTFKGYFTSDGKDLERFFRVFDNVRRRDCVRKVYFQGEGTVKNFEWRSASTVSQPDNCKTTVDNAVANSDLKDQIGKNLNYLFDEKTRILTLTGYLGDIPGKERFAKFIAQLEPFITNGCISKIVLGDDQRKASETPLSLRDFSWTLCEPPLVECAGECLSRCPDDGGSNPIINTNTNANTNTNTNTNTNR